MKIFPLFVYSEMLYVKAMPNSINFYTGIFLHVIPVRITVPCLQPAQVFFLELLYPFDPAKLVPLPHCRRRCIHYSNMQHDVSVTIPRCYKDVYVNSFFLYTDRLWNSLSGKHFPLSYDIYGFMSAIKRPILSFCSV